MITVPTHKRHKSPFKHSKTIYVFTFRWVIVTIKIHTRKKTLKGLKWPLQNGHQYRSAAGFNEKGRLQVWGGDALRGLFFEPCTSLNLLDKLDEFWTHIYNNCHPKWITINLCIMVMMACDMDGRKVNQIHKILTIFILSWRCKKTQSFYPQNGWTF